MPVIRRSGYCASVNDMKKTITQRIKRVFQGTLDANGQIITGSGIGIEQSPFLSKLFDPSLSLAQFFNTAFKAAIVVGAMLAVLRLGYAGFVYMTSDLPGMKGNAKEIIGQAVLGLLLLLSVWLILNQINPQILNLDILQPIMQSPSNTNVLPGGAGSSPY
jgi:hypothetical protein